MNELSRPSKKLLFMIPLTIGVVIGISVLAVQAHADSSNYFTGCIGNVSPNLLYNVKLGTSPSSPCNSGDNQVSADYGDITSVIAGTGLTGGATQGDATVGIANGGVGTTQLADGSVTSSKLASGVLSTDGWTASNDTWTYVSANSFKISGIDRTSVFTKGTRVKLTNNSTTYYGVVISSSYSTDTTVTLAPNNDYSLANSAITNPYYSYEANPQGYPGWFNYTTTWGGFSTNPNGQFRFSIIGNTCTVAYDDATAGTSNSTSTSFTLPVAAVKSVSNFDMIYYKNNSSNSSTPGHLISNTNSTTVDAYTSFFQGSWTASGAKDIYPEIFSYEF